MAQGRYIENVCVNKKEIAREGFMGNFIVQLSLKSSIVYSWADRGRTPATERMQEKHSLFGKLLIIWIAGEQITKTFRFHNSLGVCLYFIDNRESSQGLNKQSGRIRCVLWEYRSPQCRLWLLRKRDKMQY